VLTCIPAAFYAKNIYQTAASQLARKAQEYTCPEPSTQTRLLAQLNQIEQQQSQLIAHIQQRALEGRVRLVAYDDQLDALEAKRQAVSQQLAQLPDVQQTIESLNRLSDHMTASTMEVKLTHMLYLLRTGAEEADAMKPAFMSIVRQLIDKVIISRCQETANANLQVHGRIASILASLDAATLTQKLCETTRALDYIDYVTHDGQDASDDEREQYYQQLSDKMEEFREDWDDLQISVVAGAGFEPAAFRL
jgi:hypothetical protein